ncbi:cyclic nucleotide-binding domain-containing protein 1-like [Antechinus flavipes]|uniref:cyclic nucleotide-binding domain-containing protein 1-like n=1 Tax=Antechinus flavipes TaxID=38775 RepID=UPI002235FB51|nr:cyclic nucleotide-binding domain-containing protein 1-like [Antechinus flavipes]
MSRQRRLRWSCDTELQPSKQINYVQLEKLCEIKGLKAGIGAQSTKEAHETFMKHYKKIFQKEKRILPYIPAPSTGKISPLISFSFASMVDELHDISLYMRNIHGETDIELALKFKDKVEEFIEILKKFPIHRNVAERHFIYKMMKTIPDLTSQLTHEDFKALSRTITVETWLKGTTVLAHESFYVILKGSVRPRCKIYKKMIDVVPTNFFSDITTELSSDDDFFQDNPLTGYRSLINPHYIII